MKIRIQIIYKKYFKMSSNMITIQEYRVQRRYREERRKEFLREFQVLKLKMGVHHPPSGQMKPQIYHPHPQPSPPPQTSEYQTLQTQNNHLKSKLSTLEQTQRNNLLSFKQKIAQVKSKYIQRITTINTQAKNLQTSGQNKIQKLNQQIKSAEDKNQEISQFNESIKQELQESNAIMQKYSTEIKNQYASKLEEFQKIFQNSSEKIAAMQQQYDDDQFIQTTIANQDLIDTIKDNAEKASQDIDNILSDYKELLAGKTQILKQLTINNEMKQKEINKMGELQTKLKTVFDKLNEEKKIYIDENTKMAQQLMEVKKLLMGSLPEGVQE